jgi:hypothetical protein
MICNCSLLHAPDRASSARDSSQNILDVADDFVSGFPSRCRQASVTHRGGWQARVGVGGVVTDVTPRQTVRDAASRRSEGGTGEGHRKLRRVSPPRSGDLHARIGATLGHSLHSTVACA